MSDQPAPDNTEQFKPLLEYLANLQASTDRMHAQPVEPPKPRDLFAEFMAKQLENTSRRFIIGGDEQ